MVLGKSVNEAIQTFFGQPHQTKGVIQLLRSHKMTKIWTPGFKHYKNSSNGTNSLNSEAATENYKVTDLLCIYYSKQT